MVGTVMVLLRCVPFSYSFLGQNPFSAIAVINAALALLGFVHLLVLKRTALVLWGQSLGIIVLTSGALVLSLVKATQGSPTCIGIANASTALQNSVATDDALVKILLVFSGILGILLIENILVSFFRKQVRFLGRTSQPRA